MSLAGNASSPSSEGMGHSSQAGAGSRAEQGISGPCRSDDASFALSLPYRPQQFGFLEQACQQLVLVTEHQNARCLRHDDNRILVVGM